MGTAAQESGRRRIRSRSLRCTWTSRATVLRLPCELAVTATPTPHAGVHWQIFGVVCTVGDASMIGGRQNAAAMAGGDFFLHVALKWRRRRAGSCYPFTIRYSHESQAPSRHAGRRRAAQNAAPSNAERSIKKEDDVDPRPAGSNRQRLTRRRATTLRSVFPSIMSHVCLRQQL